MGLEMKLCDYFGTQHIVVYDCESMGWNFVVAEI